MGVGVLPVATTVDEEGNGAVGSGKGELMYMRARFKRVIGSRDSEAFYIMNPDVSSGGPEHSRRRFGLGGFVIMWEMVHVACDRDGGWRPLFWLPVDAPVPPGWDCSWQQR
ncbi:unnamed protein product [Arabidopsis halleri]